VSATGAALVLEDGKIAWPEGRAGKHAVRLPLRWRRRQIGELVCDRDTPFTEDEVGLLEAIAHHAAVALEHGRAVMRGVLAQEIPLALVFSELLQNALEHGGPSVTIELAARDGDVVLAIADDGTLGPENDGTGLSIVRALVRDELRGTFELASNGGGTRAEVV